MSRIQVHKMAAVVCRSISAITKQRQKRVILCTSSILNVYQSRDNSTTNLTAYKRGRGGHSSFSGIVATVFGANGQIGHGVVSRLGRIGSQVIIPYRSDSLKVQNLKVCGDLGQILFQEFHLKDETSIRKSMKYSDVVINLIGRNWETKNFKYADIYEHGPRRLARIAREMGISKFIHVSDLKASHDPPKVYMHKGSQALKAKMAGEEAVREEFPNAVIFRPADTFGPEDKFLHYWTIRPRRIFQQVPLWKKGTQTIKQPVFSFDLAEGIVRAITNPEVDGKIIQAVGPYRYYLCDLINYMYEIMHWPDPPLVHMHPFMWVKVFISANQLQWALLNLERIERETISDVVHKDLLTLEDLGIKLTRIEDRAPYEVYPHRKDPYYGEILGQFPDPQPPPIIVEPGYFN